MRALLLAVAEHLRSELGLPVFLCPEEALPAAATLPCVSLADGSFNRAPMAGGLAEEALEVSVSGHLEPHEPEAALWGEQGLLELLARVRLVLEGQTLGLPGMIEARLAGEEPSRRREWQGRPLLSKRATYRYLREVPA